MTYRSFEYINNLINKYLNAGGEVATLQEGSLGYGTMLLYAPKEAKLRTFIIQERFLNEWSSTHTIRGYNNIPDKYQKMLDKVFEE